MISKRWLNPTRNLFGQMLRSLARTHAASLTAQDGEPPDGDGASHPDLLAMIQVAEIAGIKDTQLRKAWDAGLEEGRGLAAMAGAGVSFTAEVALEGLTGTPGICAAPGCDEPARVRGYCVRHYRRMRYAEARRSKGLAYRPRSEAGGASRNNNRPRKPSIPQYSLEVLRETGAPLTIDRVCELVRERATDIDLPDARVLRARVRHFLYTSPKTERAGRGTFQIKGGARRVLRRPAGGASQDGDGAGASED